MPVIGSPDTIRRTRAVAIAIVLVGIVAPGAADAADPALCGGYASNAVAANQQNLSLGCGYAGAAWSSDQTYHLDWCMTGVNADLAGAMTDWRNDELARCRTAGTANIIKLLPQALGTPAQPVQPAQPQPQLPTFKMLPGTATTQPTPPVQQALPVLKLDPNALKQPPQAQTQPVLPTFKVIPGATVARPATPAPPAAQAEVARATSGEELKVPGLVMWLRHSRNLADERGRVTNGSYFVNGGDLGGGRGEGFTWYALAETHGYTTGASDYLDLPPGIVVALTHTENLPDGSILAFGQYDPETGPDYIGGFIKRTGGDFGAPSGKGFVWYETVRVNPSVLDFSEAKMIEWLPPGTVAGLSHSKNLVSTFNWPPPYGCHTPQGTASVCNALDPSIAPPEGFVRRWGGDLGAPSGEGFAWYEKINDVPEYQY